MIDFLKDQLLHNQFFSAAAVATLLGGFMVYCKSIPFYIYSQIRRRVIYRTTIYQSDRLFYDFESWFFQKYNNKYRDVEACMQFELGLHDSPSTISAASEVFYKQNTGTFVIKYEGKYLLITKGRDKLDNAQSFQNVYFNQYSISGIWAREVIEKLLAEVVETSKKKKEINEVRVFSCTDYGEWLVSGRMSTKSIENIVLEDSLKSSLVADINNFKEDKDWYKRNSILYKRGYLLYGPPGNGKTSLAFSIAAHLNKDIYCLDLGTLSGAAQLKRAMSCLSDRSLLLIEDIDSFFDGRKCKTGNKTNFSTFINCLDGAFYREGLVTIISTNHLDKLDPALIRSGRMDYKQEMPNPSLEDVSKYISKFFGKNLVLKKYSGKPSMADVQHICLSNRSCYRTVIEKLQTL